MFFPSRGFGCGPGVVRVLPPTLSEDLARELRREELAGKEEPANLDGDKVDEEDEEEDEFPQIFPDHLRHFERISKTMYYGGTIDEMPRTDRLSLSVTELCVDAFTKSTSQNASAGCFSDRSVIEDHSCVQKLEQHLDRLDMARAAHLTKSTCSSPTSLMLALLYLDRLRNKNPSYLHTVSSTDLFLLSLMVASKYLHDDGEEDEVFSDEWAEAGGMDTKELNRKELEFLDALNWSLYVTTDEYRAMQSKVEIEVAKKQANQRGWATYTDLLVLSNSMPMLKILECIAECTLKVTALCATAYAAGVMAMLGTVCVLDKTPMGPSSLQSSFSTLFSDSSSSCAPHAIPSTAASANISDESEATAAQRFQMLPITSFASDAATASLVLASLAAVSNNSQNVNTGLVEKEEEEEVDENSDGDPDRNSWSVHNKPSSLLDKIEHNLGRSRWSGGGDLVDTGGTVQEEGSGAHHSTSVLLWPNGGKDLLTESMKLLQTWRVQMTRLWEQQSDWRSFERRRQCPLLKLSVLAGIYSDNQKAVIGAMVSGMA